MTNAHSSPRHAPDARTATAIDLMMRFVKRTGVVSDGPGQRYLWTDAFAVCNLLALETATSDPLYGALASRLVDRVHHQLGRFREDDDRVGWISGLGEEEGEKHPTRGGLRIGKPVSERRAGEPVDPASEWDRDGQYFHYLTKWAHALVQMARAKRRPELLAWARELMQVAHRAFTYGAPGRTRMVWKLSTDLSRPLVDSMGQHDPLDGFVSCADADAAAVELGFARTPTLGDAMAELERMIQRGHLATADPLGIGGLLFDACRLVRIEPARDDLVAPVLSAALLGLHEYVASGELRSLPDRRLAFRELGLAIGLAGVSELSTNAWARRLDGRGGAVVASLARHAPVRAAIESLWTSPANRTISSWLEHRDINDVMLATSLVPEGFLGLDGAHRARR